MRRYDEPIDVRSGEVAGEPAPVQFLWRRKVWRVLGVETRWRETGQWWSLGGERGGDDLLAEAEVYRVLASSGRSSLPGVYELAHPLAGDAWFLRAVVD